MSRIQLHSFWLLMINVLGFGFFVYFFHNLVCFRAFKKGYHLFEKKHLSVLFQYYNKMDLSFF